MAVFAKGTDMLEGILVSIMYVLICLFLCALLRNRFATFFVRKILHIEMANWWFLRLNYMSNQHLWIGPAALTLILFLYTKRQKLKGGMAQFCFSLAVMTCVTTYDAGSLLPATASVLVLGYADSVAAMVGRKYQMHRNKKYGVSKIGTITFIIVATIVLSISLKDAKVSIYLLLGLAILLGIVESYVFPKQDNITVPMVSYLVLRIIC